MDFGEQVGKLIDVIIMGFPMWLVRLVGKLIDALPDLVGEHCNGYYPRAKILTNVIGEGLARWAQQGLRG